MITTTLTTTDQAADSTADRVRQHHDEKARDRSRARARGRLWTAIGKAGGHCDPALLGAGREYVQDVWTVYLRDAAAMRPWHRLLTALGDVGLALWTPTDGGDEVYAELQLPHGAGEPVKALASLWWMPPAARQQVVAAHPELAQPDAYMFLEDSADWLALAAAGTA